MKVFKMNDCDWVCAKTIQDAIEFYLAYSGFDLDEINPVECNLEKDGIWYGQDIYKRNIEKNLLFDLIKNNKNKEYKIKYDKTGDYDCIIYLTFDEVIKMENLEQPYLIATTEF
jgi:hypothetical protein